MRTEASALTNVRERARLGYWRRLLLPCHFTVSYRFPINKKREERAIGIRKRALIFIMFVKILLWRKGLKCWTHLGNRNKINFDQLFLRGSQNSLSWFSSESSILVESEYGNVGFLDLIAQGGKPGNREKTLGIREEPTTYSTHIWHWAGIESQAALWGGCSNPCAS